MGNLSSRARKMWGGGAASGGGGCKRDWAGLPDDLVGSIAERLSIPDHIRFRAVCASWASAAEDHPPSPSHFPWLMLDHRCGPPPQHSFVSVNDGLSYRFLGTCREDGRTCIGSRDGCLVILDNATSPEASPLVINPITGARITLPSFRTLPWSKTFFDVRKVALSAATGERFVALSLVYSLSSCHLAFARAGDEEWTPLDFLPPAPLQRIEDVVYHDGNFFAVFTRGRVQAFDLTGDSPVASRLFGSCAPDAAAPAAHSSYQVHLVSSSVGLLRVRREKEVLTGTTTKFQVGKFVSESDSGWVEIKDLGDQSLFLDDKHSVSLCAKDVAAPMRKNCIYFADEVPHSGKIKVGDLKTYDIGKCTVEPFSFPASRASDRQLMAPIWFIPSLSSL